MGCLKIKYRKKASKLRIKFVKEKQYNKNLTSNLSTTFPRLNDTTSFSQTKHVLLFDY